MSDRARSNALLDTMGKLHPKLIDLSLQRIEGLLKTLEAPHERLPHVIHVAGTNGKGSTIAFMRAMLEAAGRRVHTYTSPHLVHFHERIRLAREPGHSSDITEAELVDVLERVLAANAGNEMTFFEITTAAAFMAFAEHPADVLLLEVGLGGRLDTTNVVARPAVCAITPVSLDHTELLANTVHEIALEKAGILKPGIPAIIGPQPEDALLAIEGTAERVGTPLQVWGRDFDAFEQNGRLVFQNEERLIDCRLPDLHGRFQVSNAGVAIATLLAFDKAQASESTTLGPIDEAAIDAGLGAVRWPARMTRLNGGVLAQVAGETTELWLDGGHNPAAGQALAQFLAELEERSPKPTYLIVGMMQRKDVKGFIEPFESLVREALAVPITNPADGRPIDGAVAVSELAMQMAEAGVPAGEASGVLDALRQITVDEDDDKRVLICGSLYLAGAVLAFDRGTAV